VKILALELSSGQGSIAFLDAAEERFVSAFANDRKHSGLFFENLERCLMTCGDAERIVVGLGPGSYAGTRIAIATATGLHAATGAELIGLASLCALPTDAEEYVVIGDARRQSFWFAEVRARSCVTSPILATETEMTKRLAATSLPAFTFEPLLAFPTVPVLYPSARVLAELAQTSASVMTAPLEPLYLREPHITQPKAART
jgi:tRNA threonylcarbamoyl adenosine modification protein YeaZ